MDEAQQKPLNRPDGSQNRPLSFALPAVQQTGRGLWIAVVVAAIVLLILGAVFLRPHVGSVSTSATQVASVNRVLPVDPYARKLVLSALAMSQSTSLSGGTSTFIDGKVKNTGDRTISAITVQVPFGNDEGLSPQIDTVPMTLIRVHEPYIDTQPISAAPLKPGDEREFRLIFENIPANWNQQLPELRIVSTTTAN